MVTSLFKAGFAASIPLFFLSGTLLAQQEQSTRDLSKSTPSTSELVRSLKITSAKKTTKKAISINVHFAKSTSTLNKASRLALDKIAKAMKSTDLAGQKFRIEGHTDASGSVTNNKSLSNDRAMSVYGYLIEKGVEPARLRAVGLGSSMLLDQKNMNSPKNRRVLIVSSKMASDEMLAGNATAVQLEYTVYLVSADQSEKAVDLSKVTFQSGDRIYVKFQSSMSGIFDVYNISPDGKLVKLGKWTIPPGGDARLPEKGQYIQIEGEAGTDRLVLQYYPCRIEGKRNLKISKDEEHMLPLCSKVKTQTSKAKLSRSLAVVPGDEGKYIGQTSVVLSNMAPEGKATVPIVITLTHN